MLNIFDQFSIWTVVDISVIAFIIYYLLTIVRGTRTAQMLIGFLIVVSGSLLSTVLPLSTLHWVMSKFYSSFIIILIILFQDDIRHILGRMGKTSFRHSIEAASTTQAIDELCRAAQTCASKRYGALFVLERRIILDRYIDLRIPVDARVTRELILSIFHPESPVHDGAIVVQRGRLTAAGCFLPLSRQENLESSLGTRHRAAVGMSAETDAVVVVISEEEGTIGLAVEGQITRISDTRELRHVLASLLLEDTTTPDNLRTPVSAWARTRQLLGKLRQERTGQDARSHQDTIA